MRKRPSTLPLAFVAALSLAGSARAQLNIPTDGSDGAFAPSSNRVIDLSRALPGDAITTPGQGTGVYDAARWVVAFKFTQVTIPAGVTVSFINHPKNAPVVFLVQGNVSIAGTLNLSGANARNDGSIVLGGPGGFAGGAARLGGATGSGGQGPGGGNDTASGFNGGSFGTNGRGSGGNIYGTDELFPLIGGSGGATEFFDPNSGGSGGGAGGGAVLIAARGATTISSTGKILANGGSITRFGDGRDAWAAGSGGGIRLVSNVLDVQGEVFARSGSTGLGEGGLGRIRFETNSLQVSGSVAPSPSTLLGIPDNTPRLFPDAPSDPRIVVKSVGDVQVGNDPSGNIFTPDVVLSSPGGVDVVIEARNVPLSWDFVVRVVPRNGDAYEVRAKNVSGNFTLSTWRASIALPNGPAVFTVKATAP